jgi:hypothetical protein
VPLLSAGATYQLDIAPLKNLSGASCDLAPRESLGSVVSLVPEHALTPSPLPRSMDAGMSFVVRFAGVGKEHQVG